jgi:hypothetical protein
MFDINPYAIKFVNILKANTLVQYHGASDDDLAKTMSMMVARLNHILANTPTKNQPEALYWLHATGLSEVMDMDQVFAKQNSSSKKKGTNKGKIRGGKGGMEQCGEICREDDDCADECGTCDSGVCIAEVEGATNEITTITRDVAENTPMSQLGDISRFLMANQRDVYADGSIQDMKDNLQQINADIDRMNNNITYAKNKMVQDMTEYETMFRQVWLAQKESSTAKLKKLDFTEKTVGATSGAGILAYGYKYSATIADTIINGSKAFINTGAEYGVNLLGNVWNIPYVGGYLPERPFCWDSSRVGYWPIEMAGKFKWDVTTPAGMLPWAKATTETIYGAQCPPDAINCLEAAQIPACDMMNTAASYGLEGAVLPVVVVAAAVAGLYTYSTYRGITGQSKIYNEDTSVAGAAANSALITGTGSLAIIPLGFQDSEKRKELRHSVEKNRYEVGIADDQVSTNIITGKETREKRYVEVQENEQQIKAREMFEQGTQYKLLAAEVANLEKSIDAARERHEVAVKDLQDINDKAMAVNKETGAKKMEMLQDIAKGMMEMQDKEITGRLTQGMLAAGGGAAPASIMDFDPNLLPPVPSNDGVPKLVKGYMDSDSDSDFDGGKRANKKRTTKKRGKRQSKRNTKGGARKTKSTRKKTTRKKRRGKK